MLVETQPTTVDLLRRICDNHPHVYIYSRDSVTVFIPWAHIDGSRGVDGIRCRTVAELSRALGY